MLMRLRRGSCGPSLVATIAVALVLGVSASADVAPSGPPTSTGTGGAAASVERLATQAAIDELKAGGNAVDAAVAAAGVLGVTEPFSCGIGGGGFMVIRTADGKVTTIDGRETAPAAMTPTSFWANGAPLPFNDARWSGMSVGVPGTLATWQEALEKYGTISLAQALQPGIRVARDGFVVDQTFFDQTQQAVPWFDDIPATAALFLDPDGTPHDVGTVFRNPDLARAYERIAHLGAKGLYRGAIADAIVDTVQHPDRRADSRPRLAAGRDDDARPPRLRRARAGADARELPRARRLLDGPALERRLDRRRGAEHPRGLRPGVDDARAGVPLLPRGVAVLVRRPERVPRRSRLLRGAAQRPALEGLRGHAARAHHADRGSRRRSSRRATRTRS